MVCGPLSTSLSVSSLHSLIANQQYLPGITGVGSALPQHNSAFSGCQVHTYQVLSTNSLANCNGVKYSIKKTSLATGYTNVDHHQCQSQETAQVGATSTGHSLSGCTTYCEGLGAKAFRMRGSTCHCLDHECSTIMLNKLKGTDANNWTTYRFDCTAPNIYSSVFQSATNVLSTISSSSRTAKMVDPANFVGTNNALVSGTFSGTLKPLLSDITTLRTETFYIHSKADGGSTLMQGPYTIKLACDQSIVIKPDPAFPPSHTFKLDKTRPTESISFPRFTAWYPDDPSRNIEGYCPIVSYAPTVPGGIAQPSCTQTP